MSGHRYTTRVRTPGASILSEPSESGDGGRRTCAATRLFGDIISESPPVPAEEVLEPFTQLLLLSLVRNYHPTPNRSSPLRPTKITPDRHGSTSWSSVTSESSSLVSVRPWKGLARGSSRGWRPVGEGYSWNPRTSSVYTKIPPCLRCCGGKQPSTETTRVGLAL